MAIQNGDAHAADPGLRALALFLRLHGVNAEPDQLRERCGESAIGIGAMLRCARDFGLKVGWVEGIELNLLGGVIGIDLRRPAIKLPAVGRLEMQLSP